MLLGGGFARFLLWVVSASWLQESQAGSAV